MPVIDAADIIQVTINGDLVGQQCLSVLHYAVTTVSGAPQEQLDVFTALDTYWRGAGKLFATYGACTPTDWSSQTRRYQAIQPVRRVAAVISTGITGGALGAAGTANVAGVVTKKGDLGLRKDIGSVHIPGPPPGDNAANGLWGAPQRTLLAAFGVQLIASATVAVGGVNYTVSPVIYHRDQPLNPTPITAFANQSTVRVVRRRTVGVGK